MWSRYLSWLLLAGLCVGMGACGPRGGSAQRQLARSASLDTLGRSVVVPLKPSERTMPAIPVRRVPPRAGPSKKIAPVLEGWIRDSLGSTRKRLIVSFRDTVRIPRFPDPDMTKPRTDPANMARRDTAESMIMGIRAARSAQFAEDTLVAAAHGASIRRLFWLTQSIVVEMPLDSVLPLAAGSTVRFIEPVHVPSTPPQPPSLPTGEPEVSHARGQLNSDIYRDLGLAYGWVSIFDTGVNTHKLLMKDDVLDEARVASRENFVDTECYADDDGGVSDVSPYGGHGTKTMAILTGNDSMGDDYLGVTTASINSYRVFWYEQIAEEPPAYESHLCAEGAELAMESAIGELDPVLVMEIDNPTDEGSSLELACDAAHTAGRTVIAAAGNRGADGLGISAPAMAHNVIAVGAYRVDDPSRPTYTDQRRGPTEDEREKPDLMAPTSTETAGIQDCEEGAPCDEKGFYSGTSGATPYAAGAAVLWRNWLSQYEAPVDPGLVYAFMILSGRETSRSDVARGAGPIRMPSDGWAWYGRLEIEPGKTQPVEVELPWDNIVALEAAIWWPEDSDAEHVYHQLEILDLAGGVVTTTGNHATSVFQRVSYGDPGAVDIIAGTAETDAETPAPLDPGKWIVEISRAGTPTHTQAVYYAIVARGLEPPGAALIRARIEADGTDPDTGDDTSTGGDAGTGDDTATDDDSGTSTGTNYGSMDYLKQISPIIAALVAALLAWLWRRRLWEWIKKFLGGG